MYDAHSLDELKIIVKNLSRKLIVNKYDVGCIWVNAQYR